MTHRFLSPLLLSVAFVGLSAACSDDGGSTTTDEATETGTESGDGDGDPATGDGDGDPSGDGDGDPSGDGDGDPSGDGDGDPTGDGDGDPTGDGDGDATGDGDGDGAGCKVWEIEYDLTGSEFEIADTPLGAGDQVNTVQEPYDNDENIGPGSFIVRFQDVDGEPGGMAWLTSYDMSLNFVVASFGLNLETDLEQMAGPDECGLTSAMLNGQVATWDPMELNDYNSMGNITCTGNLCGLGGFDEGVPQPQNDMGPGPLAAFDFSGDYAMFSTETFIVQQDDQSTTTWAYVGNEISRQLIDAPECLCN